MARSGSTPPGSHTTGSAPIPRKPPQGVRHGQLTERATGPTGFHHNPSHPPRTRGLWQRVPHLWASLIEWSIHDDMHQRTWISTDGQTSWMDPTRGHDFQASQVLVAGSGGTCPGSAPGYFWYRKRQLERPGARRGDACSRGYVLAGELLEQGEGGSCHGGTSLFAAALRGPTRPGRTP